MAENSKIEWTDHTVNLWWGCSKVHIGCKNCYAEHLSDVRYKGNLWGVNNPRKRIKSAFKDLDRYQIQAERQKTFFRIFCGSMMDIFEESKPISNPSSITTEYTSDLRLELFKRISEGKYNNLVFLFLTKRPENINPEISKMPESWKNNAPKNVWFGTSISNQETANKYVEILSQYKCNNLFLSIEPQVGEIWELDLSNINWVIQGGESGSNKRPFDIKWAYQIKQICEDQSTPYFFKQIDKIQPIPEDLKIRELPASIDSSLLLNNLQGSTNVKIG